MAEQEAGHKHLDSEQRIEILEEQVKKLQQEVRDLQQKMRTHDHPIL
jgi:predicted  nucleic acid-binding Zn-ribbon protein